jgi:hypothetical protein
MEKNNSTFEFERLLGRAALALWPDLPRNVQESLFETAVPGDGIIAISWRLTCMATIQKQHIRQGRHGWLKAHKYHGLNAVVD